MAIHTPYKDNTQCCSSPTPPLHSNCTHLKMPDSSRQPSAPSRSNITSQRRRIVLWSDTPRREDDARSLSTIEEDAAEQSDSQSHRSSIVAFEIDPNDPSTWSTINWRNSSPRASLSEVGDIRDIRDVARPITLGELVQLLPGWEDLVNERCSSSEAEGDTDSQAESRPASRGDAHPLLSPRRSIGARPVSALSTATYLSDSPLSSASPNEAQRESVESPRPSFGERPMSSLSYVTYISDTPLSATSSDPRRSMEEQQPPSPTLSDTDISEGELEDMQETVTDLSNLPRRSLSLRTATLPIIWIPTANELEALTSDQPAQPNTASSEVTVTAGRSPTTPTARPMESITERSDMPPPSTPSESGRPASRRWGRQLLIPASIGSFVGEPSSNRQSWMSGEAPEERSDSENQIRSPLRRSDSRDEL